MRTSNLSPLRYPGGKSKLSSFIADLIKFNNLTDCTYIEIFAGGAGAALSLLLNKVVNRIVINDFDKGIYSFWHSILYNTDEFCNLVDTTQVTLSEWYKQKEIHKTSKDLLELGFSTFFLNRTNRSGIINGGAIGGINQQGNYKIDCRFNKINLIERIKTIASYKDNICVTCIDAKEFIVNNLPTMPLNSLVYLDPPYYKKGPDLYTNFYKKKDHEELSEIVKLYIRQPWIVTYDNEEDISKLYNDYYQIKYSLNYSVSNKYKGKEILIYSDNIIPLISEKLDYCI